MTRAGGRQFVGQLHAGGGGADHQDAAAGQGPGGVVGRGGQLDDPGVEPGRQAGDVREVTPARGQDHRRSRPGSGGRHDAVAAAGPPDREYLGALGHRCGGQRGVAAQVVAYLGGAHEAGRVGPAVAVTGQTAQPVRGQQAQRVPGVIVPAGRGAATFQDDVISVGGAGQVAHGQARLAGADDHNRGPVHQICPFR